MIKPKENIDFIVEWAIWRHLDSKTDLELILLKGHLLLDQILQVRLNRDGINNIENFSLYGKILEFQKLEYDQVKKKKFIISSLKKLNKLRNQLAHEYYFDPSDGEFELWALNILKNLKGEKFSRFTFRTKIVHAFSNLAINVLELTNEKIKTTANST